MTDTTESRTPALTKDMRDRVNDALKSVSTVADLDKFLERIGSAEVYRAPKGPIVVPEITEQHLEALKRLPEIYGKVVPKTDRALNSKELAAIAEERQTIDLVLGLLESRKSNTIRETLANHLDHVYAKAHPGEEPPTDAKGHVAAKAEILVPGTPWKVARSVAGGKRVLTMNEIERLRADGTISEEVYEKITRPAPPPPTPRVLDEDGLVNAMKGDPALAYVLANATRVSGVTTTITVKKA